MLIFFTNKCAFYLTYKIIKFTLKHFFTVTPTCFGPYIPSSESLYYTKSNFGQAQYRHPDDSLHGPKHIGVTVKKCFNVNFNVLYVK